MPATVGTAFRQGLVDCRYDFLIPQHHVDVPHPGLLQILNLFSDQPVAEAALQASRLAAFRPIRGLHDQTQRGRVAPNKSAIELTR
jgi:hypothetical protein